MRTLLFALGIACLLLAGNETQSGYQLLFTLAGFACVVRGGLE